MVDTPRLHFAISSMHHDVCMHLVENKADVRICRYVALTLLNNVTILGTFVDSPHGNAVCKVMPVLQPRSASALANVKMPDPSARVSSWLGKVKPPEEETSTQQATPRNRFFEHKKAAVSPEMSVSPRSKEAVAAAANNGSPSTSGVDEGMYTRVESLSSSPLFRERNPRDVVYFRTAPGSSLIKPNVLCVLLIGDHVAPSEMTKARGSHDRGKLFHLLIENLPAAAMLAMDSFRTPLFRCTMVKNVREFNQRWILNNKLKTLREKHNALLLLMKGTRGASQDAHSKRLRQQRSREAQQWIVNAIWRGMKKVYKLLRRVRNALSVQNVFASSGEHETMHKDNIICEPKGILYEYIYDHAEFRGGWSPTLALVVQVRAHYVLVPSLAFASILTPV